MAVPNAYQTVVDLANKFPREFREAHTGGPNTELWIRLLAYELHTKVDRRFGLNGKRGTDTLSQDAINFKGEGVGHDPTDGQPVTVIDVIGGAGGANPTPSWQVFNDPVQHKGPGKWIQPRPVAGYHDNPVQPPPPAPGPVEPPQFVDLTNAIQKLTPEVVKNSQAVREMAAQEKTSREAFASQVQKSLEDTNALNLVVVDELRKTQEALRALTEILTRGFRIKAKGNRLVGDVNGVVEPQ